jgi:hypothetical protein
MNYYWYLGELVNYAHVFMIGSVGLAGILWIRPAWAQPLFVLSWFALWPFFHGRCPVTCLSNWLQSTDWDSFVSNFAFTYGRGWGVVVELSLLALSFLFAYRFRRPL